MVRPLRELQSGTRDKSLEDQKVAHDQRGRRKCGVLPSQDACSSTSKSHRRLRCKRGIACATRLCRDKRCTDATTEPIFRGSSPIARRGRKRDIAGETRPPRQSPNPARYGAADLLGLRNATRPKGASRNLRIECEVESAHAHLASCESARRHDDREMQHPSPRGSRRNRRLALRCPNGRVFEV
jgi:hypothetical protein